MSLCSLLFGVFRSEKVASIRINPTTFHDDYMTIKVEKSKTDQLRQGDEVAIAQSGGRACPVSILRDYLSRLNILILMSSFSDSWLKPGHPISWLTKVKPISYTTFRDHLSKSLRSVVPDASVYGTHSFRSGELPKLPIASFSEAREVEECFGQGWLCKGQYHF